MKYLSIIICVILIILYMTDEPVFSYAERPPNTYPPVDLSHWMTQFSDVIQHVPLHKLRIPGTHNAGAYALSRVETGNIPACLSVAGDIIADWGEAQGVSVLGQLQRGARYLDFRVVHKNGTFFAAHWMAGASYDDILGDVAHFLRESPGEIVICDFHHFYGFSGHEDHDAFLKLIHMYLGGQIVSRHLKQTMTCAILRKAQTRALCLYRSYDDATLTDAVGVWPRDIVSRWPKAYSICDLCEKLKVYDKESTHAKGLCVLQGVVTPDVNRVFRALFLSGQRTRNLKQLSAQVSHVVCCLVETGILQAECIVMLDFIDSVDVSLMLSKIYYI